MNTSAKAVAEKAKNYSAEQEEILRKESPFNLERAKELAASPEFEGKSWQSIVAKVKNLGLDYIPKPPPVKKVKSEVTKSELVAMIEKHVDRKLTGLEKASRQALLDMLNGVQHLTAEIRTLSEADESGS